MDYKGEGMKMRVFNKHSASPRLLFRLDSGSRRRRVRNDGLGFGLGLGLGVNPHSHSRPRSQAPKLRPLPVTVPAFQAGFRITTPSCPE